MFARLAGGQGQFAFDKNGNLLTETPEIAALPQVLSPPQPQVVGPGALASFFVVVADTRGLTYQWRFNGTNFGGATSDALLLQDVGATNEGLYSVVLTNNSGSVTSAPAMLWFDRNRNGLPDTWELAYFRNLNQTATGDFDGDGVSNLDEFLDGTNPTNSVSARFRLTVLSDGGLVSVVPTHLSYTNGEMVTLTATPSSSEPFRGWTGDANTTSNSIILTMTNNKTVFAHFRPSNLFWTNLAGGDWQVASNWKPNLVPSTNDDVFITEGVTVTLNSPAECHSLTFGDSVSGPTLTGSGNLTVHGASTWERGTMSGAGRTIIPVGATLNVANAILVSLNTRTLENGGTVVWTGVGNIGFADAVITNRAGALFETRGAGSLSFNSGGATSSRFDNAGTFRKSVSTGTTTVGNNVSFNNYGTVEIQTGTLLCSSSFLNDGVINLSAGATNRLAAGGSGSGTFTAPATALVEWTGGTFTLNSGAQLNGGGLYRVNGGTVTCNTDVVVENLDLNATLNGTGTLTVNNQMNWTSGTMSGSGRTIIPVGATLNVANAGGVTLNTRILENGGTVLWTGAGLIGLTTAVITNRAGALFHAQNAATLNPNVVGSRLDNAGTFRKSVSAGTTTVASGMAFNNYGAVEIQTGTLLCNSTYLNKGRVTLSSGATNRLAAGGSASGSFTASPTALVEWTGGTFTLDSGAQLNGGGLFKVNGGNVTCNTDVEVANLDLNSATLGGTGTVTVNIVMNWTGGTMNGNGRTVIPTGGTLNLANAGGVTLNTRTLENGGTVLWTGAAISFASAVITNRAGAVFETRGAGSLSFNSGSGSRFDNAGTFRKSVNTGTTTAIGGVAFNNYNNLEIQTGIFAANGGYTSTANSLLNCTIGGTTVGTGYGRLQVAGTVALNGALSVALTNGFLPAINDTFTVLTAGTRSGTFASFSYPSTQVTMQLSNTANSVIVRATAVANPRPILLSPELSGTDIRLIWTAVSNTIYRLEFNPDLGPSNWNPLAGDVTSLSNTASKLDALTLSNRFYRVHVVP